jgi:SsrA-binding protein
MRKIHYSYVLKLKPMDIKIVSTNKKARFEYQIFETFEAGIVLKGSEIKSIRLGQVSLQESYIRIDGREAWLVGATIAVYKQASILNHNPNRERKLLLHEREIHDLWDEVRIKGITLVPTKMYLKNGRAKLEIGLAKGKKQYDKREAIKERDIAREDKRRSNRDD